MHVMFYTTNRYITIKLQLIKHECRAQTEQQMHREKKMFNERVFNKTHYETIRTQN